MEIWIKQPKRNTIVLVTFREISEDLIVKQSHRLIVAKSKMGVSTQNQLPNQYYFGKSYDLVYKCNF